MSTAGKKITAPFSLLLPVYHADTAQQLRRCVHSSFNEQTLEPAELILVQDGPVNTELENEIKRIVADLAERVKYIRLQKNQGLVKALNQGLAVASYDTVARIDADDICYPERFAKQWARFSADNLELLGTGMAEFAEDEQRTGQKRVPPVGLAQIFHHAKTHNPFNHPTVMYSRAAVLRVGGYAPLGNMEDYWLFVRMLDDGARADNLAEPLVKYRVGGGVYKRRGGLKSVKSELQMQRALKQIGFISLITFVRNCVLKSAYRLLPVKLKKIIFGAFVANGLPGEKNK